MKQKDYFALFVCIALYSISCFNNHAYALDCSTVGDQKALVISVSFQNDPGEQYSISEFNDHIFGNTQEQLSHYWNEVSYGRVSISGDVAGHYVLPINADSTTSKNHIVLTEALKMAAVDFDVTQYSRIFIAVNSNLILPNGVDTSAITHCLDYSSPDGTVHASVAWFNYNPAYIANVGFLSPYAHEGGHLLHLEHASSRDYGTQPLAAIGNASAGIFRNYNDGYDAMGRGQRTHYNAHFKYFLDWLHDSDIASISTNQSITIEPLSTSLTGIKAARIFRGIDTSDYSPTDVNSLSKEYIWVETRQAIGYDVNILKHLNAVDAYGTAVLHLQHNDMQGATDSSGRFIFNSELIDTHPTGSQFTDYKDAGLYAGETFTDPFTGLSIRHNGLLGDNLNLEVSYTQTSLDSDADGITDITEATYGSRTDLDDTDEDGLTDLWEVCYDGDCNSYDPYPQGGDLNLNNNDTDNDFINDKDEVLDSNEDPITPKPDNNPGPSPIVDFFAPESGSVNSFVSVFGSNFCSLDGVCDKTVTKVIFDGKIIKPYILLDFYIAFYIPIGVDSDSKITVQKQTLSSTSSQTFDFTVQAPRIHRIDQNVARVNEFVVIKGSGFCLSDCWAFPPTEATVCFNGICEIPAWSSWDLMTAQIPNGVAPGPVSVLIFAPGGLVWRDDLLTVTP